MKRSHPLSRSFFKTWRLSVAESLPEEEEREAPMKSSSSWMAVTVCIEVPRRRPLAVRYDKPSSPEGSLRDPELMRSWNVTNGRECSSQTMRISRLGSTVLWTGGMAETAFDCRERKSSNNMRIIVLKILVFIATSIYELRNFKFLNS
jgi:hypothetical protein